MGPARTRFERLLAIRNPAGPVLALALAVALAVLGLSAPASGSHTESPREGLDEAGFHALDNKGFNTDIMPWASEDGRVWAATGTWGSLLQPGEDCPSETDNTADPEDSGVWIVEATDPDNPELAARLGTIPGAQNNDLKVDRLPTTEGNKDLLVHSLEPCGVEGLIHQIPGSPLVDIATTLQQEAGLDQTGFQIYDVSDPANPVRRGTFNNGGLGTHDLYLFSQGERSFVAAVRNEVDTLGLENARLIEGSLQIVDITDPDDPTLVSEWDLHDAADQGGPTEEELCHPRGRDSAFCYNHDVWTSDDGTIAYNAWWDGGLILLDISDPANPTFIGQAQDQVQPDDHEGWLNEEGNTHSMVPMEVDGRHVVVVGDEDFTGGATPGVTVNSPAGLAGFSPATQWGATGPVSGQTSDLVYAGTGCTAANYLAVDAQDKIVIVDKFQGQDPGDECPTFVFKQKMDAAETAGAIGLVQVDDDDEPSAGDAVDAEIPGLEVSNTDGAPIRDAVVAGETVNATLERGGDVSPWGFMRVLDIGEWGGIEQLDDPSEWREVAQFKAPHVEDPNPPAESEFTAHNPILGPDGRIYMSWYSNGVRVLELSDGGATVDETASFVPLPTDHEGDNDSDPRGIHEDNMGFWGSWPLCHPGTGELLVFNSDGNRGIYVLRALYDDCRVPDLTISSDDISFSGRGRSVTIDATVHNVGEGDADDVAVRFESDSTGEIGTATLPEVAAGESATATMQWDSRGVGSADMITVTVDPDGLIEETNEFNNSASALWRRNR